MKAFFLKFALFLTPLLLFFSFPLFVFFKSGELIPLSAAIEKSLGEKPALFGLAYSNLDLTYKREILKHKHPEVLAYGTSRVGTFTSNSFKPEASFYNSSRAVETADDLHSVFNEYLSTNPPKILIVGIDPHFLNVSDLSHQRDTQYISSWERTRQLLSNNIFSTYADFLGGKFKLRDLTEREDQILIGLGAKARGTGFRNDGSVSATKLSNLEADIEHRALEASESGWEFGASISEPGLLKIEAFLAQAQKSGTRVIGFAPPYSSKIQEAIKGKNDEHSRTLKEEPKVLGELFKKYGAVFFDTSDPSTFGSDDSELLDGIHGSEAMYTKLIAYLGKKDKTLKSYLR